MKKITATVKAWLPGHCGPNDLSDTPERAIDALSFTSHDMTSISGWTLAGTATVTVDLVDDQALVDNKVASLREELKQTRVAASMKEADIELKIQKLLAIEYTPEVTA